MSSGVLGMAWRLGLPRIRGAFVFVALLSAAVPACNVGGLGGGSPEAASPSSQATSSVPLGGTVGQGEPIPAQQPFPAEPGTPRLFFSDLESGPNSGGEGGQGAFVTLYGEGFGGTRIDSTVTVGGEEVARYVEWGENNALARGLDQIVVQLGPESASGDILVTVGAEASNPLPFTVRGGHIYFVSPAGNDSNPGTFESPWASVSHAAQNLEPGDIAYLMDGIAQTSEDNYTAALAIETSGEDGWPKALVGYPDAAATIGSTELEFGVRVPNNQGTLADDWLIANLILRGGVQAVDIGGQGSSRWRLVGNDISCPVGDGQTGCFAAALADHITFLGNRVHDVGAQSLQQPSKQYHAVYFTTDTNYVDVGWNEIRANRTCRAIQIHSSPLCTPDCGPADTTGFNQHDIEVHDNWIQGDSCDGIVLATVDPSQGPVRVYNNIVVHTGAGPHPPDGEANYSCVYVAGGTNNGPDGQGAVLIAHNTCYDFASVDPAWADAGAFGRGPGSPDLIMDLRNNLVMALPGQPYFSASSLGNAAMIRGDHNLFFGNGPGPNFLANNIDLDPLLTDPGGLDFHLAAGSPAIDAGMVLDLASDFGGIFRPQGAAMDIGAYEFVEAP